MQYKIPVQIENEDIIFAGLSLRQLGIIACGCGLGYTIFQHLGPRIGQGATLIPAGLVILISLFIALFRVSEMTFSIFFVNFIRFKINGSQRVWMQGVDSYSLVDVGYVVPVDFVFEQQTQNRQGYEVYETIEDQLHKI